MASRECTGAIANAVGLDAATQPNVIPAQAGIQ
jgi:hypothetical protein